MQHGNVPNFDDLVYRPQEFHDLYETDLGHRVWDFMKHRNNLIRMETSAFLDRAAIEPLIPFLLEEFGTETTKYPTSEMIKHMACQVMEAMGYNCDSSTFVIKRNDIHLNEPRDPKLGNRHAEKMKILSKQREAWRENVGNELFSRWLNRRVRDADDKFDLNQLYHVAQKYGIEDFYEHLCPGLQRIIITNKLRKAVPEEEIVSDEEALYEQGLIRLNDADWSALHEALERPVMPKPRLAKLLAEKVYSIDLG